MSRLEEFALRQQPIEIDGFSWAYLSPVRLNQDIARWHRHHPQLWKRGSKPLFYSHRYTVDFSTILEPATSEMIQIIMGQIGNLLKTGGVCNLDSEKTDFVAELSAGRVELAHIAEHVFAAFYDRIITLVSDATGQKWFNRAFYTTRLVCRNGRAIYRVTFYQELRVSADFILSVAAFTRKYLSSMMEGRLLEDDPQQILRVMAEKVIPSALKKTQGPV